jgi:F-box protein 21
MSADFDDRVHDNSERYVAEENVELLEVVDQADVDAFPIAIGRFFKRWDGERNVFVSNVTDEYPED